MNYLKNWYDCFIVIDRYENRLSFWQSFRRRWWSLGYQKKYREHQVKYGYDFDYRKMYRKALHEELSKVDPDPVELEFLQKSVKYISRE